eukprot:6603672-Lingulodinium_polyedra.AAC.1
MQSFRQQSSETFQEYVARQVQVWNNFKYSFRRAVWDYGDDDDLERPHDAFCGAMQLHQSHTSP